MATLKCLPVNSAAHLHTLIEYVQNSNKTMAKELVTCSGCQLDTAYNDFSLVKSLTGKKGGVLAHQIIHSFAKGEIDETTAHEISCRFAEENIQGYQYTVCTHVDKGHIHSHIVFNSVNSITRMKYAGNLASLAVLCKASNELCRLYGLSTVEANKGLRSLDKTTYELAKGGSSWKFELLNVLNEAIDSCKTKDAFDKLLSEYGYNTKWTDKNITIQVNAKYKIRLNTFAKQFGGKYSKAVIEVALGLTPDAKIIQTYLRNVDAKEQNSTFSINEKKYSDKILKGVDARRNYLVVGNISKRMLLKEDSEVVTIKIEPTDVAKINSLGIAYCGSITANGATATFHRKNSGIVSNSLSMSLDKFAFKTVGNISIRELINSYGETSTLKISPTDIPKLENLGIFYNGIITSKDMTVSFKAEHNHLVAVALGVNINQIHSTSENKAVKKSNELIKAISKTENKDLFKLILSENEVKTLLDNEIPYSFYRDGNNYATTMFREDLRQVTSILGRNYQEVLIKLMQETNGKIYSKLSKAAQKAHTKLEYRVIDKAGLLKLQESNLQFAFFEKDNNKYNLAFLPQDIKKYAGLFNISKNDQSLNDNKHQDEPEQHYKQKTYRK